MQTTTTSSLTERRLRNRLETMTDTSQTSELAKFRARLEGEDPLDAFEWGEAALRATARFTVGRAVLRMLENAGFDKTVAELRRLVMQGAQYPSQSTSPLSNLCAQQKLAAMATLLEE